MNKLKCIYYFRSKLDLKGVSKWKWNILSLKFVILAMQNYKAFSMTFALAVFTVKGTTLTCQCWQPGRGHSSERDRIGSVSSINTALMFLWEHVKCQSHKLTSLYFSEFLCSLRSYTATQSCYQSETIKYSKDRFCPHYLVVSHSYSYEAWTPPASTRAARRPGSAVWTLPIPRPEASGLSTLASCRWPLSMSRPTGDQSPPAIPQSSRSASSQPGRPTLCLTVGCWASYPRTLSPGLPAFQWGQQHSFGDGDCTNYSQLSKDKEESLFAPVILMLPPHLSVCYKN